MKTQALFFPFDLFGSSGAGAGAELLADAVREMLADNRCERKPTRARAYTSHIHVEETAFEKLADYQTWRDKARARIRQVLSRRDFLLWVTGNHLGVLPIYDDLARRPEQTLVVQFDAHLDIYNLSDCIAELSHGNYLLHCDGPLPPIINVGHRELLLKPDYVAKYFRHAFSAAELAVDPEPALAHVRQVCAKARRVFVDLDCDVFDPAFFPALANPLPVGLSPAQVLRFLDAIGWSRLAGVALSEFVPARDMRDQSLATLIWLIEHVLLMKYEPASKRRS